LLIVLVQIVYVLTILRTMIENLTTLNVIQFVLVIQVKHVVVEIEFRYTILGVSNPELSTSCVCGDPKIFRKF